MEDCFCRGELKFLKTSSNKVWVVLMAVSGHFLEFLIILWKLFQFSFLKMVLTHQPAAAFHVCETHLHLHTFTFLLLYWGRAISIFALTAAGRDLLHKDRATSGRASIDKRKIAIHAFMTKSPKVAKWRQIRSNNTHKNITTVVACRLLEKTVAGGSA